MIGTVITHWMGYEDRHFCPMALILCSYIWLFHTCKKKSLISRSFWFSNAAIRKQSHTKGRGMRQRVGGTQELSGTQLTKHRGLSRLISPSRECDMYCILEKKPIIFDTHDVNTLVYGRIIKCVSRNKAVFILSFSFLSYLGLTNG